MLSVESKENGRWFSAVRRRRNPPDKFVHRGRHPCSVPERPLYAVQVPDRGLHVERAERIREAVKRSMGALSSIFTHPSEDQNKKSTKATQRHE